MSTYRYRLRFFVHFPGVIQHEEKSFNFMMNKGIPTTLSSMDSESISKGKEFVLSSGGFCSEEDAFNAGTMLKDSLLVSGVKFRIGIDVGKDKSSSTISNYFKDKIFNEHGIKIIDNVHGLIVYSEEFPVSTLSISGEGLVSPANAEKFTNGLTAIYGATLKISDKQRLALELYGASHFEKSDRARFITLVLAVEALLEPPDRENSAKKVVDYLIEYTKDSQLDKQDKDSIMSSLKWLYKESISKSLREMAENYLGDRKYNNMCAKKFINQCYDIRSKLVHTGKVDIKVIHLGTLAAQLNVFVSDLLVEMTGIRTI